MGTLGSLFKGKTRQNAIWLICGNIVYKIIAFIVGIFTARYLGPGNYGLINYASAYTTFFFSLATLGINSILVKKIIDNPHQEGMVLGTTLVLQGCSSLLSVFVIMGIVFFADFGDIVTITVVFLVSLGLFFQMLDTIKYWFQAKLESKYATVATVIAYLVASIYQIVLLTCNKSVEWFALAKSIDYLCVAVILFAIYKLKKGPKLHFSRDAAKKLLKESYPFILSGLMVSVYGATDKLMLKQMIDDEAVGYYSTAVSISVVWVFVLSAIIDSVKPVIMQLHNTDLLEYRKKNIQLYRIVFYLSLIASIGITVFSELGISILYGDAYRGAIAPLRVATWYVAFSYLGVARDAWIVCEGLQKYLPKLYAGAALINVILNYILIPKIGASGAALASLITQMSTIFIMPSLIKSLRPNVLMMVDAVLFRSKKKCK